MYLLQKNRLVFIHENEDDEIHGPVIAKRLVELPGKRLDMPDWIPSRRESILKLVPSGTGYYAWIQLQSEWEDAEGNMAPLLGNIALEYDTMGEAIRTAQKKQYIVTRNEMIIKLDEGSEEDPTEVGLTTHHLFTNPEVREALIKMYGEPVTPQEEERLKREMTKVRRWMPTYEISEALHRRIHGLEKLKKQKKSYK